MRLGERSLCCPTDIGPGTAKQWGDADRGGGGGVDSATCSGGDVLLIVIGTAATDGQQTQRYVRANHQMAAQCKIVDSTQSWLIEHRPVCLFSINIEASTADYHPSLSSQVMLPHAQRPRNNRKL